MFRRLGCPLSLSVLAEPERFKFQARLIRIGPITMGDVAFGAPVSIEGTANGCYHVDIPTVGHKHSRHSGAEVVVRPNRAGVYRPFGPFSVRHSRDLSYHTLVIERHALENELEALLGRPVHRPLDLAPTVDLSDGPGSSWSALVQVVREDCERPGGLVHQPLIAERMWRGLVTALLFAVPHRYSEALVRPAAAAPPRTIHRVMEAIHDGPHRSFTVAELARIGGISVRALQEGFRRHVGVPPMAYLQAIRLDRAHEQLRRSDPGHATVAGIAHRWGFAHLGRFAHAYRRRYGVNPSTTLRHGG